MGVKVPSSPWTKAVRVSPRRREHILQSEVEPYLEPAMVGEARKRRREQGQTIAGSQTESYFYWLNGIFCEITVPIIF